MNLFAFNRLVLATRSHFVSYDNNYDNAIFYFWPKVKTTKYWPLTLPFKMNTSSDNIRCEEYEKGKFSIK